MLRILTQSDACLTAMLHKPTQGLWHLRYNGGMFPSLLSAALVAGLIADIDRSS